MYAYMFFVLALCGLQAENGSGLRETADELRKELESARANMASAVPASTHNATLSELKQV